MIKGSPRERVGGHLSKADKNIGTKGVRFRQVSLYFRAWKRELDEKICVIAWYINLASSVIEYTWRELEFQAIFGCDLYGKPAWKQDFEPP